MNSVSLKDNSLGDITIDIVDRHRACSTKKVITKNVFSTEWTQELYEFLGEAK